jgi:hypothetical protein
MGRFRGRSAPVIREVFISPPAAAPLAARGVAGSKSKPNRQGGRRAEEEEECPSVVFSCLLFTPLAALPPFRGGEIWAARPGFGRLR